MLVALDEERNLRTLLPELSRTLGEMGVTSETIVVDGGSRDGTPGAAADLGARVIVQARPGYGEALREGLAAANGRFVLTMDADLSHGVDVVPRLWAARDGAGIAVASRYMEGGGSRTGVVRLVLSRVLNVVFSRGLSVRVHDVSSGFRIYPAEAMQRLASSARDFDILPELLVRAHSEGWRVTEVPFRYQPRGSGSSKARLLRLGAAYLRTFARLWRLRNSIAAADYDERAYDSVVPLQRAWQRRRHRIVTREAGTRGRIVDVGCGSSRILRDLPRAIGLDLTFPKLRYMRRYGVPLVQGSIFALPFRDASVDVVVCSEVIEHVPAGPEPFAEIARINRPGGTLVLGTPDYGTWTWRLIEVMYRRLAPGGYADEHITRYDRAGLIAAVAPHGYRHLRTDHVFGSEMILTFERR